MEKDLPIAASGVMTRDAAMRALLVTVINMTQAEQAVVLHYDSSLWVQAGRYPVPHPVSFGALVAGMVQSGKQAMHLVTAAPANGLLHGDVTSLYLIPLAATAIVAIIFAPRSREGMVRLLAQQLHASSLPLITAPATNTADMGQYLSNDAAFQQSVTATIDNVLRDTAQADSPFVHDEEL